MKSRLFIICLSFAINGIIASDNSKNEQFLNFLFMQDYTAAQEYTASFDDLELKKAAGKLATILYVGGQGERLNFKTIHEVRGMVSAYLALAKGYQNLYLNRNSTSTYTNFRKVYDFAKKTENILLLKFSLISILEVYNYDVIQTNDSFEEYLEKFGSLRASIIDEYYFKIFILNFQLRDVHYEVKVNNSFIQEFDKLIEDLDFHPPFTANYYSSKGVYLEVNNKFDSAITLHKRAIELVEERPFLNFIRFRSFCHLAEISRNKKDHKKAIQYINEAILHKDKADSIRSKYYTDYYLALNYREMHDWKNAYKFLRSSDSISILLDYQKNSSEISQLNVKYQTAEKEKQILMEQQRATTNRNWLIAAAVALLFGTGIATLLQQNTTKKRRLAEQQQLLEQQKVETLLKEQELVSIDAMIAGQEKERQKVANELHDDLGSLMATVKLHFDNVKVDKKDPALKNAQKLLEEAYQKIRGMAHAKNSGVMANHGLLPAVRKMAKIINETNSLKIEVEDFGLGERMENSLELTIFRIIQELTANVIKHAEATNASIQFTQHKENLNIIIEDNGQGFDMSRVKRNEKGMGLGSIEKRIEHLEGTFTVDSVLGKGTSILIDIPV